MFRRESKPQNRIDSLIGATTRIEGNVFFSGGLRVDGAVRGNVAALPEQPGTLVVSEHARVDGEVVTGIGVSGAAGPRSGDTATEEGRAGETCCVPRSHWGAP